MVEIHPQSRKLLVYLKVDSTSTSLEAGFTRDVSKIAHFGSGNLVVVISSRADHERAQSTAHPGRPTVGRRDADVDEDQDVTTVDDAIVPGPPVPSLFR